MAEEHFVPLSLLPPSRSQQSLALGIAVVLLLIAVASQPFAQIQIAPITAFAPVVAAIELVSYGLTATLLFATYSVRPVAAILALATGYVFTGLAIIAWASSFPGAFAANGLLGNSPQISFYLAYFINAGIGVSALAYVALSGAEDRPGRPRRHIVFATLMAVLMAAGATAFVVTFADRLPPMMFDEVHVSPNWRYVAPLYLVLYVAAIAAVAYRRRSVLDTWLLLALWGWLLESVMLIRFQYRFTVGWYVSLFFEFFSASVVLAALLSQLTALYGRLALAMTALQRERENRMLTVNAALASVAHETNQPISAIVTNGTAGMRLLARGDQDVQELTAILTDIVADGRRASDAIEAIRAVFRGDSGTREALDLPSTLIDVLLAMQTELQQHGIALDIAFEKNLPRAWANRSQLQQVVHNLVANAIEAMDSIAARARRLRIGAAKDGDKVLVTFQDSGPGIEPGLEEKIFDPFVTSKPNGTGLGLSICRSIIEAHGGSLRLVTGIPNGAVAQFTLPVADAA